MSFLEFQHTNESRFPASPIKYWIGLSPYARQQGGKLIVGRECNSIDDLKILIDELKGELDDIGRKAKEVEPLGSRVL